MRGKGTNFGLLFVVCSLHYCV